MKKLFSTIFICTAISLSAQKQYRCYHVQEFMWNPKTGINDLPVERGEISVFKIDDAKKMLVQTFEDGNSLLSPIKTETTNASKNAIYTVISPSNGYTYNYQVNTASHVIEVVLENGDKKTLLKKYLYKD